MSCMLSNTNNRHEPTPFHVLNDIHIIYQLLCLMAPLLLAQGDNPVLGSRNISIVADADLKDVHAESFDIIVIPGGLGGAQAMRESALVGSILRKFEAADKIIAAICACPSPLARMSPVTARSHHGAAGTRHQEGRARHILCRREEGAGRCGRAAQALVTPYRLVQVRRRLPRGGRRCAACKISLAHGM